MIVVVAVDGWASSLNSAPFLTINKKRELIPIPFWGWKPLCYCPTEGNKHGRSFRQWSQKKLLTHSGFCALAVQIKTPMTPSSVKLQKVSTQEHRNDVQAAKLRWTLHQHIHWPQQSRYWIQKPIWKFCTGVENSAEVTLLSVTLLFSSNSHQFPISRGRNMTKS